VRQDGEGVAVARRITRTVFCGTAAGALALTGCAGTYDLVTSQRFKERPFHTLFVTEDPMDVLEHVQEGDDRVRAMHNLKEPKENGGTQAQQDRAIAILQEAATVDNRPLIRLAAVEALARFKDQRVGPILVAAYHQAGRENQVAGDKRDITAAVAISGIGIKSALTNFTPDTITNLQCRSLESLGDHRTSDGLQLLVQVAGTPTDDKPKPGGIQQAGLVDLEVGTGLDRIDVRLAAIRALGSYNGDPTAVRALVGVLKTDKDVAVRGRAHEALCKITGQDLPPDGSAWQAWLDKGAKK
jgi:HEAT repeat protein